jgi:hypothetical protein
MAKKKKQKKAGLAKRQKNKQAKKIARKRREIARKPVQKKISPSKVKQNLKNMPTLIFEPELREIAFTPQQVERVKADHEKIPDQIEALSTDEFTRQLEVAFSQMKERFDAEGDVNKSMMVHAIMYYMEQEHSPSYLNQIIVAMYYQAIHASESEEPVPIARLNSMLKEYDEEWGDYLREKMELLENTENSAIEPVEPLTEEEAGLIAPSPFEELLKEFSNYLTTDLSMDEDNVERAVEDVEVLVNDFFEEKEITSLDEIRPRKIKTFLEGWFPRVMHPTREDLETMILSLESFFKFCQERGRVSQDSCQEILELLGDKEAFLS